MLRTPLASSLLFTLGRRGGLLGLPEVIEIELVKNLSEYANSENRKVNEAASALSFFGYQVLTVEPFDVEKIRVKITDRLRELSSMVIRFPFTLDHARNALVRVNAGTPPNGPKDQQFKDSAVWEAILQAAADYDVHFATADKGFFQGRDPRRGLAAELAKEVAEMGGSVSLYHSDGLEQFLEQIQEGLPQIDREHVLGQIAQKVDEHIRSTELARNISIENRTHSSVRVFVTPTTSTLALSFDFEFGIVDRRVGQEGNTGRYTLRGICQYNVDQRQVSDFEFHSQAVFWTLEGEQNAEFWGPFLFGDPPHLRGQFLDSW